jgi:squalene synthase HpnC
VTPVRPAVDCSFVTTLPVQNRSRDEESLIGHPEDGHVGSTVPTEGQLTLKERAENFPVALRVLPSRFRTHLHAVYAFARTVDDLGDQASGDRTAQLGAFRADLARVWGDGAPDSPVLRALVPTVRARGLPAEPFDRLVQANLRDQEQHAYGTIADLRDYCALSADPVGRIVLGIFGAATPAAVTLSDRICTALQLVEHWQDVAEDRRAGRVYLPADDLAAFGVTPADLDAPTTPEAVRRLVAYESGRAGELLVAGEPLLARLRGWARLAVTGYLAGGLATLDALRRAGWRVLDGTPRPRRRDVLRHLVLLRLRPGRHVRAAVSR